MKASELISIFKGHGLTEDAAKASALKSVQDGQCEDDMGMSKAKASAVLADLMEKGQDGAAALALVKGQIAEGKLEDDLQASEVDALVKASKDAEDAINKGVKALEDAMKPAEDLPATPDVDPDDGDAIMKARLDIMKSHQDILSAAVAKGDQVIKASLDVSLALAKATQQRVQADTAVLKGLADIQAQIKGFGVRLDSISKGIGTPMAPRHSAYAPVPHPGEVGQTPGESFGSKLQKAIDAEFAKPGTPATRKNDLYKAGRKLTDGFDPRKVAEEFDITIAD